MKQLYFLIFLIGLSFPIFGQSDTKAGIDGPFIYLFDGTIITAEKITYNSKLLSKDFIMADDKKYEIKQVKFYQNTDDFYANSRKYQVGSFLKREVKGNANVYYFRGSVDNTTYSQGGISNTSSSSKTTTFYNVGFGDLKKMKYSNIKIDFANNPDAMIHVNKFKQTRNIKRSLLIGGAALMLSTVLTVDSSVDGLAAVSAGLGATSLLTGVFWGMNRDKHLNNAIKTFNL